MENQTSFGLFFLVLSTNVQFISIPISLIFYALINSCDYILCSFPASMFSLWIHPTSHSCSLPFPDLPNKWVYVLDMIYCAQHWNWHENDWIYAHINLRLAFFSFFLFLLFSDYLKCFFPFFSLRGRKRKQKNYL